jgi:hypothetical protein
LCTRRERERERERERKREREGGRGAKIQKEKVGSKTTRARVKIQGEEAVNNLHYSLATGSW